MFTIILTVILIMPAGVDDLTQHRTMISLDDCTLAAKQWLMQDVTKTGGVGLGAGCSISPTEGIEN